MWNNNSKKSNAFTLVELLVVIAIIGLLISLLIPAIQAARESARRSSCANNMKQISLAMLMYHDALKSFPSGNIVYDHLVADACHLPTVVDLEKEKTYCGSFGWPVLILPFLEETSLYEKIDFETYAYCPTPGDGSLHSEAHGDPKNQFAAEHMPDIFTCVSSNKIAIPHTHKDYGVSSFGESPERNPVDKNSVFHCNSNTNISDISRGTSNTLMLLELAHAWWWQETPTQPVKLMEHGANPFFWVNIRSQGYVGTHGRNGSTAAVESFVINGKTNWYPTRFARSYHPKGINTVHCDGSISFLSETIKDDIFKEMSRRSLPKQ